MKKYFLFFFIILFFFFPICTRADSDTDLEQIGKLIADSENLFLKQDIPNFEPLFYTSPEMRNEILNKTGMTWEDYQECHKRIIIYSNYDFVSKTANKLSFDRIDLEEEERIDKNRFRLRYKVFYKGDEENIMPKDDESWFIKINDKWYFDLYPEMKSDIEKDPNQSLCPDWIKEAMKLSKQLSNNVVWVEKNNNTIVLKIGDKICKLTIIYKNKNLLFEISRFDEDNLRFILNIGPSLSSTNFNDQKNINEVIDRIKFVEKLTNKIDSSNQIYFDDIQNGIKRLSLDINDYKNDVITFNARRDYLPGEKKLSREESGVYGGKPVVVTVSFKDNSISEKLDQSTVNENKNLNASIKKVRLNSKINLLQKDLTNLLFLFCLFSFFAYFIQYLINLVNNKRFIFIKKELISSIIISFFTTILLEFLVIRYVGLGAADLAVSNFGWPFGLIFGILFSYIAAGIFILIIIVVSSKFIAHNDWKYTLIYAFVYLFFIIVLNHFLLIPSISGPNSLD